MPSRSGRRKDYSLVDDAFDSRLPLHNEDAFLHGINFKAKYIGTLDVPRPSGRTEIVIAMRRIRYEFKAKSIKKRKVNIRVSTEGVRVVLRKKKVPSSDWAWNLDRMVIMQDPIYRIFYVSHDSHDLKIWSYIARDGASNIFRCNVFKSPKKSLAMHVVRTVGQAFDVCHKLNIGPPSKKEKSVKEEECSVESEKPVELKHDHNQEKPRPPSFSTEMKDTIPPANCTSNEMANTEDSLCAHYHLQLSRQKILHAEQRCEAAMIEMKLLKSKLASETAARVEAQACNHQLLLQNKELLKQLSDIVVKLTNMQAECNKLSVSYAQSPSTSRSVLNQFIHTDISFLEGSGLIEPDIINIPGLEDASHFENTTAGSTAITSNSEGVPLNGLSDDLLVLTPRRMGSEMTKNSDASSTNSSSEELPSKPILLQSSTISNADSTAVNQTQNTSIWNSTLATPLQIMSDFGVQGNTTDRFSDSFIGNTPVASRLSNNVDASNIEKDESKLDISSRRQLASLETDSTLNGNGQVSLASPFSSELHADNERSNSEIKPSASETQWEDTIGPQLDATEKSNNLNIAIPIIDLQSKSKDFNQSRDDGIFHSIPRNKGQDLLRMSLSSNGCKIDPVLSRFDPLLLKSKSFELGFQKNLCNSNSYSKSIDSSPTPLNSSETSGYDSYLPEPIGLMFSSPKDYERKFRYEPLVKQREIEKHSANASANIHYERPASTVEDINFSNAGACVTAVPLVMPPGKSTTQNADKKMTTPFDMVLQGTAEASSDSFPITSGCDCSKACDPRTHNVNSQRCPFIENDLSLLDDIFITEVDKKTGFELEIKTQYDSPDTEFEFKCSFVE